MANDTLKRNHFYIIVLLFAGLILILCIYRLSDSDLYRLSMPPVFHIHSNLQKKGKLLVIFTSFKNDPNKSGIHQEVINNWLSLGNDIQPILFYNQSNPTILDSQALSMGWIGLPIGRTNKYGTPKLKHFYASVTKTIKSQFYGFCNGDIFFDDGMKNTLKQILKHKTISKKTALVIGRRTNIEYQDYHTFRVSHSNHTNSLNQIANSKGSLYIEGAEDYFFVYMPHTFPWDNIKDVVIGRPYYDNYLVSEAIKHKVSVIDATNTILSVHLTGVDGNHAGSRNIDKAYNIELIGKTYPYGLGSTSSAQYYTARDENGKIIVEKR